MSQLGEGTHINNMYMNWSQECLPRQETEYMSNHGPYYCSPEQSSWSEDSGESGDYYEEVETEEHKVCVMSEIVAPYEVNDRGYQGKIQECSIKNEDGIPSHSNFMPVQKCRYQDRTQQYCIKDELLSPCFGTQGCEMKCNFQNNPIPRPPTCTCAKRGIFPFEICDEFGIDNARPEGRKVTTQTQADAFECGLTIECLTCGKIITDRKACVILGTATAAKCDDCIKHDTTGSAVASHFASLSGCNAAADTTGVPCEYCRKVFKTVKGMKIHVGRMHKEAKANR